MKRSNFLKSLAVLPFIPVAMKLSALRSYADSLGNSEKMPVLFIGHGSPMNGIEENRFVSAFRKLGKELQTPKAILCISAHWETKGTFVASTPNPRTIHDFGGFPKELFEVQYPAPGSPELAKETQGLIKSTQVHLDDEWGLDHGAWTVIKHFYPNADIPVVQMSIDYTKGPQYHYELAKELAELRTKGILIVGSGNMVHNLRTIDPSRFNAPYGFDWAHEANDKLKSLILTDDHQQLIDYRKLGREVQMAIPTPDHYLPLLYALALKDKKDDLSLFNDEAIGGSITMTSVKIMGA